MKLPTYQYFENHPLFHFGLLILAIILLAAMCFFLWKQISLQSNVDDSLQTQILDLQNQVVKKEAPAFSSSIIDETDGITTYDVKNSQYNFFDAGKKIKLVDGVYDYDCGLPGGQKCQVKIYNEDMIILGDLNEDGKKEAAVVLSDWGGGTGNFRSLHILAKNGAAIQDVANVYLGDRVVVRLLKIEAGKINLNLLVQGPGDGMCCPSKEESKTYYLSGNSLRQK
jgi:hypothetical protein